MFIISNPFWKKRLLSQSQKGSYINVFVVFQVVEKMKDLSPLIHKVVCPQQWCEWICTKAYITRSCRKQSFVDSLSFQAKCKSEFLVEVLTDFAFVIKPNL